MRYLTAILFGLIIAAASAQAGGVADLVAKKSNTREYNYNEGVQLKFLHECTQNAKETVCQCVLNMLQKQYSEKDFLKLDADLQKGLEDDQFTSFISFAVEYCDAEYENEGAAFSEEDAKAYVDTLFKYLKKKDYITDCVSNIQNMLGNKGANKVCNCEYNKLLKDKTPLIKSVMENGGLPDNNLWLIDFAFDCLPDKMTPEIKKYFINGMNQMGLPNSVSQCTINAISKEYSLKSLFKLIFNNSEAFTSIFKVMGTKCAIEQGLQ